MRPRGACQSFHGCRHEARFSPASAVLLGAFLISGCDDRTGLVARVDHAPITAEEVDYLLAKRSLSRDAATAAQRAQAEEELIDQELLVQQARDLGLDQRVEFLQTSKRLLARAYLEHRVSELGDPSEKEIAAFYNSRPELFRDRRRYQLQEIAIQADGEWLTAFDRQFKSMRTFNDLVTWLNQQGVPYKVAATFKSADEIPADLLPHLTTAREGQALKVQVPAGIAALQVVRIIPDPVSFSDARDGIRKYLRNRRIEELLEESSKALRASARIERYSAASQDATPR